MRLCPFGALILALSGLLAPAALAQTAQAEYLGSYRWSLPHEDFGGFSGLEVSADGLTFVAISDRGLVIEGRFQREGNRITGTEAGDLHVLRNTDGGALGRYEFDAEGLAQDADGQLFMSFEAVHRVWSYPQATAPAKALPRHKDFAGLQNNSSLEALAIDDTGVLYTLPERSGKMTRPFPVYCFEKNAWRIAFSIPRRGEFLPVGADFGPDGRLYLLERHLNGIFGFQTRVRSFRIGDGKVEDEQTLIETSTATHDNLEGLSAWRDADGAIRLTMISDDNFRAFQSTEFVEYRLTE